MKTNPLILVIDDEHGICEGIKRALTSEGFNIETALTGEDGLQIVNSKTVDLVLLDVMMPDVNGIDLISSIHEHDPEIVCVIITGYATVELAVQAIKKGAYDFLTKPFSIDDLALSVSHGLEKRRLSLEAKRAQEMEEKNRQLTAEKQKLEDLARAKGQFFRLVTHELKAPIGAIMNYLHLIQDGYISKEEIPAVIEKSIVRAEEELALISDLLELGRIQAIPAQMSKEESYLNEILMDVKTHFSQQIQQKNIQFDMTIDDNLPAVPGVSDRYKSVWMNLIDNAVKYTPNNGRIAVRLSFDQNSGKIIGEVKDSGIGIPPEDQKDLFTEFYRASNVKDTDIQGTGLGLTIVKQVIEQAGGSVSFESKLEHGSTFQFIIPVKRKDDPTIEKE